jgi:hypothetical protein
LDLLQQGQIPFNDLLASASWKEVFFLFYDNSMKPTTKRQMATNGQIQNSP